jgi:hypothetical protein
MLNPSISAMFFKIRLHSNGKETREKSLVDISDAGDKGHMFITFL